MSERLLNFQSPAVEARLISMPTDLQQHGFTWLRNAVPSELCAQLLREFKAWRANNPSTGRKAGARIPLAALPGHTKILALPGISELLRTGLNEFVPLRAIYFDKTAATPWGLGWHRDSIVPVQRSPENSGLAYSVLDGVPHVRGSREIMQQVFVLRIYFDSITPDNGPMRVLPGTHQVGAVWEDAPDVSPEQATKAVVCLAEPGDVLLMSPLLLHDSLRPQRTDQDLQRRVLNLEMRGPDGPPMGFQWG